MGAHKSKTHEVTVKLRFDKPVTRGVAVRAFNDSFWGEFYATFYDVERDGWETGKLFKAR